MPVDPGTKRHIIVDYETKQRVPCSGVVKQGTCRHCGCRIRWCSECGAVREYKAPEAACRDRDCDCHRNSRKEL